MKLFSASSRLSLALCRHVHWSPYFYRTTTMPVISHRQSRACFASPTSISKYIYVTMARPTTPGRLLRATWQETGEFKRCASQKEAWGRPTTLGEQNGKRGAPVFSSLFVVF